MLNPEFRLLDPETEHMERLATLSGVETANPLPWSCTLLALEANQREAFFTLLNARLATPGSHPLAVVQQHTREIAQTMNIQLPEPRIFGFPEPILARVLAPLQTPCVMLLGVLNSEGIWAGCLAGISKGGLDFFTTFQHLWADEPELASKQTLDDFHELLQAAGRRFARPVGGLFIQHSECETWKQQGWAPHFIEQCTQRGTAAFRWPYPF